MTGRMRTRSECGWGSVCRLALFAFPLFDALVAGLNLGSFQGIFAAFDNGQGGIHSAAIFLQLVGGPFQQEVGAVGLPSPLLQLFDGDWLFHRIRPLLVCGCAVFFLSRETV
jgi:hypothetical protein